MDMHHRLRRDPAWHPNSCNICGQVRLLHPPPLPRRRSPSPPFSFSLLQMGHQAAQCTVGTVNWRSMYGPESFLLRRPLFWSEIQAMLKAKSINFEDLEAKAKEYAEARLSGKIPDANGAGAAAAAAPVPPEEADLPPGWATAKDAEGKTYYWHRETKAVQWDKPTADGAAPPAAAAPEAQQQA